VRRHIGAWKAADLNSSLARATRDSLGRLTSPILRAHHLPQELFYIALQESKFDVRAVGPQTRLGIPKGMWQLMPATAEAYGLQLGPLQGERAWDPGDERYDVSKATAAAARYLSDLYETDAQASGLLVMAAYNMGETRLLKLIRSLPESPADRNFWALLEKHGAQIPSETRDYVFRVVAAAVIGANPRLFGYAFESPIGPP
jgi:soluble lytic murein transglycosylase-like protein